MRISNRREYDIIGLSRKDLGALDAMCSMWRDVIRGNKNEDFENNPYWEFSEDFRSELERIRATEL